MTEMFIPLNMMIALQVVTLGFIGGVLSGFIGSGGAFFMTPGMMNLGVPGVVAVGSNITHKFGKAMMGSKKHGEMGNVDRKMGFFMLITAAVGIRVAVWISTVLFAGGGDSHGASGSGAQDAPANLYISVVFVSVLTLVALSMLRDIISSAQSDAAGPSRQISEYPQPAEAAADDLLPDRGREGVAVGGAHRGAGHGLSRGNHRRRRVHRRPGHDLRLRHAHRGSRRDRALPRRVHGRLRRAELRLRGHGGSAPDAAPLPGFAHWCVRRAPMGRKW